MGNVSYQVFARKYRPQTFDDVVGQEHVVQTLENAVRQHRLAHAYLFVGPRGVGKTSTARILAKALNCPGGPRTDFDPNDEVCREIAEGRSLDVLEIDGASNNGVEQVRELRENVRFAPTRGQFKIYIIDEVHMLTTAAFNALLKTLEEPPPHVKFIFATTEPHKVLPTILSRCQRFDLRRITARDIAEHLGKIAKLENIQLEPRAAVAIAKAAEGGMRDAESMLDQLVAFCGETIAEEDVLGIFGLTSVEIVAGLAGEVIGQDNVQALASVRGYADEGKDLMKLLGDLLGYLRNLLILKTSPDSLEVEEFGEELLEVMRQQAGQVQVEQLLALIDLFAEAEGRMKWAPNKRLHFEVAVIKGIHQLSQTSIADIVSALTALSRGESAPGDALAGAAATRPQVFKPSAPPPRRVSAEVSRRAPEPSPNPNPDVVLEPRKTAPTPASAGVQNPATARVSVDLDVVVESAARRPERPAAPAPEATSPGARTSALPAVTPAPAPAMAPPAKLEFGDRATKSLFETLPGDEDDAGDDFFGGGSKHSLEDDLTPKFDLGYDNPDQEMLFGMEEAVAPAPPAAAAQELETAPEVDEPAAEPDPEGDLPPEPYREPAPRSTPGGDEDDATPPWDDEPPTQPGEEEPVGRRHDGIAALEASLEFTDTPAAPAAAAAEGEAERLWKAVQDGIKGVMLRPAIHAGVPLVLSGDTLEVAYRTDSDGGIHLDTVWRRREEVEAILLKTAGTAIKLKLSRSGDLPEVEVHVNVSPAPAEGSGPPLRSGAGSQAEKSDEDIQKEFLEDPLIRKALAVFRAEVDGVEHPA